jgi:hypothetical protein
LGIGLFVEGETKMQVLVHQVSIQDLAPPNSQNLILLETYL